MANPCKIRNTRLSAIYDVIKRLNEEQGITDLPGVFTWFKDNYGDQITQEEIIDSLVATSTKKVKSAVRSFEAAIKRIEEEKQQLGNIEGLVDKSKASSADLASEAEMKVINEATAKLFKAIDANRELSATEGVNARLALADIQTIYQDLYNRNPEAAAAARQNINRRLSELKSVLRVNELDSRLKALRSQIENLKSDDVDASNLVDPNAAIPTQYSAAVLEKEAELSEAKSMVEDFLNKRKIQQKAEKHGIFGFVNPTTIKMRVGASLALKESWEVARTMKFFFDASAYVTQLAPIVIPDLVGIDFKAIRNRDFANVFSSQKRLAGVLREQFIKVLMDDFRSARGEDLGLRGLKNILSAKRATGQLAREHYKRIVTDPTFGVLKKNGLIINESRSITNTAEMFHATFLNRLKSFGLAKDISEDLMVGPLNTYRFLLAKEFYLANPGISPDELKKALHFINELTGTSHLQTGVANWMFSAPRLLLSRLHLAFFKPIGLIPSVDIKRTITNPLGGLQFQTATDQFIANQLYRMYSGYAKMFMLIAAIGAIRSDVDWPEKWDNFKDELGENLMPNYSSDWLRVKSGHIVYDFTGGIGALYRMLAKMLFLQNGPGEDASFKDKERYNYYTNVLKDTPLSAMTETLFQNKLHPTITGSNGIYTGRDFFGQPFTIFGEAGPTRSRVAAAVEAFSPIFITTATNQYFFTPNSKFAEDTWATTVQFFGLNTFEPESKATLPQSKEFFNRIQFQPHTDYPKELTEKGRTNDLRIDYLRDAYKKAYENMLGDIIESNPNMTKSQFQARVKSAGERLQKQFVREHKGDIDKLPKPK